MRQNDWERLTRVLEDELKTHEIALSFAHAKQDALVLQDMHALQKILVKEEDLVERIRQVASARHHVMQDSCESLGIAKDQSLTCLLDHVTGRMRGRLSELRAKLSELMQEVSRVNRINTMLVQQTLEHIRGFLGILIYGGRKDQGLYTASGQRRVSGPNTLFSQKV